MTYNTNLAKALRKRGVKVVEEPGWQRRGHGKMSRVVGVCLHHTVGPKDGNFPSRDVLVNGRPDLEGPLCNLGYDRDGKVHVIAGGTAWHAGQPDANSPGVRKLRKHTSAYLGNSTLLGIEMESTGTGPYAKLWTASQRLNLVPLLVALCRIYKLKPSQIIGHKEWAPTRKIDPAGISMDDLRREVERELNKKPESKVKKAVKKVAKKVKPVKKPIDHGRVPSAAESLKLRVQGKLVPTGILGEKTIRKLQAAAFAVETGVADQQTWHRVRVSLGLLDPHWQEREEGAPPEAQLVDALQRRLEVSVSGKLDARTIRALQRFLNANEVL